MSMLINGVNPPPNCYVCSWYNKVDCPVNNGRYYYRVQRHPDCPLVEIPTPHGRLIDADNIYIDGEGYFWFSENEAPTVIEAEGSET